MPMVRGAWLLPRGNGAPCALAALLALCLTTCSPAPRPSVVIVVLDTVRPDYLSVYGHPRPTSPFLESFAPTGVRYERAWSSSCWTLPAHASLFSGRLPSAHRATQTHTRIAPGIPLLAERLAESGYRTAGFTANPWVGRATGLARGFETFKLQHVPPPKPYLRPADHPLVAFVREWLAGDVPGRPFFLFVNLLEPHMPYLPAWEDARHFFPTEQAWKAAGNRLFPLGGPHAPVNRHYGREQPLSAAEWSQLRALYEGEVRRVDALAGAILEAIDATSDPKQTLVFLLSDHGENLGDHDHLGHIFNLYDSNLRIALLARGPGFPAGTVEERPVHITDLYPTIVRAAGLRLEEGLPGLDLRGDLPATRPLAAQLDFPIYALSVFPRSVLDSGVLRRYEREIEAVVDAPLKLIRGSDGSAELYDLTADPAETLPLSPDAKRADLQRLHALLDDAEASPSPTDEAAERLDQQTIEALRALGYVR